MIDLLARTSLKSGVHTMGLLARPVRLAFIVNSSHELTPPHVIDQIIKDALLSWGGRGWVIIPSDGESISSHWWELLNLADPDQVFVLTELSTALIAKIRDELQPVEIVQPKAGRSPYEIFVRTRLKRTYLSGVPRAMWERDHIRIPLKFFIFYTKAKIEKWTCDVRFIHRNFGTLDVTLQEKEAFEGLPLESVQIDQALTPVMAPMKQARAQGAQVVCPIHLSQEYASVAVSRTHAVSNSEFQLVVGDATLDIIYYWNRPLVTSSNYGTNTAWIPSQYCNNKETLEQVLPVLLSRYRPSGAVEKYAVLSSSVSADALGQAAASLKKLSGHEVSVRTIEGLEVLRADDNAYGRRWWDDSHFEYRRVAFHEGKGITDCLQPPFLRRHEPDNVWAVELGVKFPSEYVNFFSLWRLPRKSQIAKLFVPTYDNVRVSRNALPTFLVTAEHRAFRPQEPFRLPPIAVRVPTTLEVAYRALCHVPSLDVPAAPRGSITNIRVSDVGRRLAGLIGLFGDLNSCSSYFDNPYWGRVFAEMSGDRRGRRFQISKILAPYISGDELEAVTNKIAARVGYGARLKVLNPKDLRGLFGRCRSDGLRNPEEKGFWEASEGFGESFESDLRHLVERRIFLQGAQIKCRRCQLPEWYEIDELSTELRCSACLAEFVVVAPQMQFRLNELVVDALATDIVPLVQAYQNFGRPADTRINFLPLDLFLDCSHDPFTDLDLAMIVDGRLVIGEVKADPHGFKPKDLEKLAQVALAAHPDCVVLAAPCSRWPDDCQRVLQALQSKLGNIKVIGYPIHRPPYMSRVR